MHYEIQFERAAIRAINRLPADIRRRVEVAIKGLAENPRPPGVKAMTDVRHGYRIKVGRTYRVVYTIEDDHLVVLVVRVGHRRDVYRNLGIW